PGIRCHVHRLVHPGLVVSALMEDRLQDGAGAIGDVSILPVEGDAVEGAGPVPEGQRACTRRYRELLIERAVAERLLTRLGAKVSCLWVETRECGKSPAVRKGVGDYGVV